MILCINSTEFNNNTKPNEIQCKQINYEEFKYVFNKSAHMQLTTDVSECLPRKKTHTINSKLFSNLYNI